MTPAELQEARHNLGLTLAQMGALLGYSGEHLRQQVHQMEVGLKPIRPAQARLVRAYLSGYRPEDWPT